METTFLYVLILKERLERFLDRGLAGWSPSFQSLSFGSADVWLTLPVYFASAESEGRTEEPTERKKRQEREKGRVPKSPDIPSTLVTIGGLVTLFLVGSWMLRTIADMTRFYLGNFSEMGEFGRDQVIKLLVSLIYEVGWIMAPLVGVAVVMALVGNIAQVGLMFTLKPIQPDFKRIKLDFPTMMRKVFFSRQIAVNLIKTLLKVGFLAWVGYYIIVSDFTVLMELSSVGVSESISLLGFLAFKLAMIMALILFVLAVPDYFYQRFEFTESIKMTREEVRQESKESEGDPLVRQRRRQKAFELLRRNMLQEVPKADVVITNPTHYAVALRYDPGSEDAPRVLAKGEDHMAFMIRNMAKRNEIPIIENKPLARELYATVPEGEVVPEQFYRVLIDLFLSIDGMRERLSRRAG